MPENCPLLLRGLYLGLHRRVSQFGTDKLNPDKNDERCCRERREQRKVTSLLHRMLSQRKPVAKLFHQPIADHSSSPAFKWFAIIGLTNSRLLVEQFACQSLGRKQTHPKPDIEIEQKENKLGAPGLPQR